MFKSNGLGVKILSPLPKLFSNFIPDGDPQQFTAPFRHSAKLLFIHARLPPPQKPAAESSTGNGLLGFMVEGCPPGTCVRQLDTALDDIDKFAWPDRLHQGLVGISTTARHLEQVAAHHNGLRAKLGSGVGDAEAVRQSPIGYDQRILVGVKVCPPFGLRRREVYA